MCECVVVLMTMMKFSGVKIKLMRDANDQNGTHGGEHQHNNDINEQWETKGQRMTKDGIGSKLTYHGIISPFATIKQHEKLNNGHPHFIQSHTEMNRILKSPNSWKHIQSFKVF